MSESIVHNIDCMIGMKEFPDKYFDLAICDIPYGIDVGNMAFLKEVKTTVKQKNGTRLNGNKNKKPHEFKDWDKQPPSQEYFDELKRISKNQIIFGIEYVDWTGVVPGRIKWNKGVPDGMSFKSYEILYCSFVIGEIELDLLWSGMNQAKSLIEPMTQQGNKTLNEKRIHPTQKPIKLYEWLIMNFAAPGDKILDSHVGSGSSRIACDKAGLNFVGYEIDKDYWLAQEERFKIYKMQLKLF